MDSFREQLSSRSSEYVEEILSPYFGGIIQFVKEGESLVEKGQADQLKKQESKQIKLNNKTTGSLHVWIMIYLTTLLKHFQFEVFKLASLLTFLLLLCYKKPVKKY